MRISITTSDTLCYTVLFIKSTHGYGDLSSKKSHVFVKILHGNLKDINPIMQELITPLHLAAQYSHFDVCKYICDNSLLVWSLREEIVHFALINLFALHCHSNQTNKRMDKWF